MPCHRSTHFDGPHLEASRTYVHTSGCIAVVVAALRPGLSTALVIRKPFNVRAHEVAQTMASVAVVSERRSRTSHAVVVGMGATLGVRRFRGFFMVISFTAKAAIRLAIFSTTRRGSTDYLRGFAKPILVNDCLVGGSGISVPAKGGHGICVAAGSGLCGARLLSLF